VLQSRCHSRLGVMALFTNFESFSGRGLAAKMALDRPEEVGETQLEGFGGTVGLPAVHAVHR
jgi:hypothetical protein